jgi:hypothetical protein
LMPGWFALHLSCKRCMHIQPCHALLFVLPASCSASEL